MQTALFFLLLVSCAMTLMLAAVAFKRKKSAGPAAIFLAVCLMGGSIYSFGYAMEIMSADLPQIMFWVRFQHWGIQFITPTWLLFAVYITGRQRWVIPWRIAALFAIPVLLLLTSQTLGGLNLLHINPRLDTSGQFPTFTYDRGFWIYVYLGYFSLCLAATTYFFTVMLVRASSAFRIQAAIYWIASLIPWVSGILYNLELTPAHLDITPFAASLSGILFGMGFLKYRLLDILPLARDVIIEGMDDGFLVLDNRNQIIDFNLSLKRMLPEIRKNSLGLDAVAVLSGYPVLLDQIRESSTEPVELRVSTATETIYYRAKLAPLVDSRGMQVGKVVTLHDYSHVKSLVQKLEELAQIDGLTGVYNRRHFIELATTEMYRLQRFGGAISLIMLDVDHFKRINDSHGHAAGDAALTMVVNSLRVKLRQSDIIGRFGGEEFFIMLPQTDPKAAAIVTERLRAALERQQFDYEGSEIRLTASFGITGVVSPAWSPLEDLIRCADKATYEAKSMGGNRIACDFPNSQQESTAAMSQEI
jgi:diguanylate cyclase (GGDEF)-like protein